MRVLIFSKRCAKEILRDPINLAFGLGFPIILLFLLSLMQKNIPANLYKIETLTPAITVFGFSFITLFSATLVAKDRESSFLNRLYTTPLKSIDFIVGYMLPFVPIAMAQSVICYTVAAILGLTISVNVLYALLTLLPISVFYISLGLLCGSIFNVKQVGALCGALLTNISAWLSGIWFDISLLGDTFETISNFLPFLHAVELEKAIINSDFREVFLHLTVVILYSVLTTVFSVLLFLRQMNKQ